MYNFQAVHIFFYITDTALAPSFCSGLSFSCIRIVMRCHFFPVLAHSSWELTCALVLIQLRSFFWRRSFLTEHSPHSHYPPRRASHCIFLLCCGSPSSVPRCEHFVLSSTSSNSGVQLLNPSSGLKCLEESKKHTWNVNCPSIFQQSFSSASCLSPIWFSPEQRVTQRLGETEAHRKY